MPRLVDYICEKCGEKLEELYSDTDLRPVNYSEPCTKCGGRLVKQDWKANCQRWNHNDRGGL